MLISSVLQAARRYDFMPRLELFSTIARFAVLAVGLQLGFDFFAVVVAQTLIQVGVGFAPGSLGDDPRAGPPAAFRRCASLGLQIAAQFQLLHRA